MCRIAFSKITSNSDLDPNLFTLGQDVTSTLRRFSPSIFRRVFRKIKKPSAYGKDSKRILAMGQLHDATTHHPSFMFFSFAEQSSPRRVILQSKQAACGFQRKSKPTPRIVPTPRLVFDALGNSRKQHSTAILANARVNPRQKLRLTSRLVVDALGNSCKQPPTVTLCPCFVKSA